MKGQNKWVDDGCSPTQAVEAVLDRNIGEEQELGGGGRGGGYRTQMLMPPLGAEATNRQQMNTNVLKPTAVIASHLHTEKGVEGSMLLAPPLLETCLPSSQQVNKISQHDSPMIHVEIKNYQHFPEAKQGDWDSLFLV